MYGHTAALARTIAKGAEAEGANVTLFRVPETLSDEVRSKMHA
jgi:NAD(P)H dehydrogenase (quinone)